MNYGDDPSQYGILRIPQKQNDLPAVVSIHGGFWQSKYTLEENTALCENLTDHGHVTWNIEYRRTGETGGGWPETLTDVISAANYIELIKDQFNLNFSDVIVVGHSAGGHLALMMAVHKEKDLEIKEIEPLKIQIKKIVSLAGITDLQKMIKVHEEKGMISPVLSFIGGNQSAEVSDDCLTASPNEYLPLKTERLLIHGELDRHVPVGQSTEYAEKASRLDSKVKLFTISDADHFEVIHPESLHWQEIIRQIKL